MPHQPSPPPGTRFFARLDQFHCECPACGAMILARKDGRIAQSHSAFKRRRGTLYNPITSVVYCPGCRRAFGCGLILWPLNAHSGARKIPADHKPTRRQLSNLQQSAYGIWGLEIKKSGAELNIAVDQECTCPEPDGWDPICPVHSWARAKAEQEALRASETPETQEREPLEPPDDPGENE